MMLRRASNAWWRTFAHMDEFVSSLVILFSIVWIIGCGGMASAVLEHFANQSVGYLAWAIIAAIGFFIIFSVEYAPALYKHRSKL